MPRRQQRTSAIRRNVPLNAQVQPPQADWFPSRDSSSQVRIAVYALDSLSIDDQVNWQLNGIPPFEIYNTGIVPLAAVQSGSYLVLTYPPVLPSGFTLQLPAFNDSMRSRFGAYLVGKSFLIPSNPPAPLNSVASINNVVGTSILFDLTEPEGINLINGLPQWSNTTTSEFPYLASLSGSLLELAYNTAPSSGEVINIPVDDYHIRTVNEGYVQTGTLVVP